MSLEQFFMLVAEYPWVSVFVSLLLVVGLQATVNFVLALVHEFRTPRKNAQCGTCVHSYELKKEQ